MVPLENSSLRVLAKAGWNDVKHFAQHMMHRMPSIEAGFSPSFEIGLRLRSHQEEAEVVTTTGMLQMLPAHDG